MNGIVALCHFCETHGPKILLCCQPFHEHILSEQQCIESSASSDDGASSPPYLVYDDNQEPSADGLKLFYGRYDLLERAMRSRRNAEETEVETCAACRSVDSVKPAFLTNDHENRISYISCQYPYFADSFASVQNACLRSLSCEISPDTGDIFFGDELNGYTISHTFLLQDSKARGFHHWYSLVVVSKDRLLLLNHHGFIVKCLKGIVEELQWKATKVYEAEQEENDNSEKTLRLMAGSRVPNIITASALRQRATSGTLLRPLTDITNDPDIFRMLHRNFVWLLKTGAERVVELVLEGAPTQDTLVRFEHEMPEFDSSESVSVGQRDALDGGPFTLSSGLAFTAPKPEQFDDLRAFMLNVGPELFHLIAYHVVVGNQLIVRADQPQYAESLLSALTCLLPIGCCRLISYSDTYEDPWKANLLGLPRFTDLSVYFSHNSNTAAVGDGAKQPVIDQEQVLVVIDMSVSDDIEPAAASPADLLEHAHYRIHCTSAVPPPSSDGSPSVLKRMESLLADKTLSINVLERTFVALKEEWLSKVKAVFEFIRQQPVASGENDPRLLQLLSVLKCGPEDWQVLKFWQGGLSRAYREHVRTSCTKLHQVQMHKDAER